ncbi:MAG: CBS domain-containing protein, partial [Muribaculaceae bacterium]|nr:CBS domain-containing protein [Muribaculaceae bacterium]
LSELFTSSGRSKILVYKEDIDNILGYIHVSELFHPEHSWEEAIKPVIFAPETLLANKMMRRLLTEKRSMAIIVDEFGGTAGMVTLEDLVEEIFGDIQDEHDLSGLVQHQIAPNVFEFSGRMEIEAINELYHLNLPESDDYQTLAGFIMHTTGSLPQQGETIIDGNLSLQIMKKTATRLELIRITVNDDKEEN